MSPNRILIAFALAIALSLPALALALQRPEILPLGKGALHAAVDPASGRLFVAHGGMARADGVSVSVVDPNGRVAPLTFGPGATHIALSARHRRAVAVHPSSNQATIVDLDTLQARTVITGISPSRAIVSDNRGFAYVIGKGPAIETGSGSVTEIDLRTGFARTFPLPGFGPEGAIAHPAGARVFVFGTTPSSGSGPRAGYIQSFDMLTRSASGAPAPIGHMPRHVLAAANGEEIYVVGHLQVDDDMRRVLFVMDANDLATKRILPLPDARDGGRADLDPETNQIYLLDPAEERLVIVDPASGQSRTVALEAPGAALAVNALTRRVMVSFDTLGQAGIFSMSGERLDTVSLGRAPAPGQHHIAVDGGSGFAHVTNGHMGTVARLPAPADAAPVVVDFTDLWFDPRQPGWGVFLDQQGAAAFATLFTHDPTGHPTWLFMSNGLRQPDGAFAGDLHRTRGPLAEALKNVVAVGTMRFEPVTRDRATLTYYVDGGLHTRNVQRFRTGDAPRSCRWMVDGHKAASDTANFTSLWSNPADPGWGLAVSHQGDEAFGVLFTYDEQNRATWAVMSTRKLDAQGAFAGDVYRAVGERLEAVGRMSLAFSNADRGMLRYRLGGLDFRGPVIRQTFGRLTSHCTS